MSTAALAPRKPQKRDDVVSRTPLRVRERVAFVRYWRHVHKRTQGVLLAVPAALVLEHYRVTFPFAVDTVVAAWNTTPWGAR